MDIGGRKKACEATACDAPQGIKAYCRGARVIFGSRESRDRILLMCMAGFATYALFNFLAMLFYPGGTAIDAGRSGYSFFGNFFSDLGMAKTYSGEPKPLSLFLFSSALVLIGVVLIVFFVLMAGYFSESKLERYSSRIGSLPSGSG